MPAPARVQAGAAAAPAQEPGMPIWRQAVQGLLMFCAIQFTMKQVGPYLLGTQPVEKNVSAPVYPTTPSTGASVQGTRNYTRVPEKIFPLWPVDSLIDVSIYVTENPYLANLHDQSVIDGNRVFYETAFSLSNKTDVRESSTDILFSDRVQHNATLFALIVVAKDGAPIEPSQPGYSPANVYKSFKTLTRYHPKKKYVKVKKLIGKDKDEGKEVEEEEEVYPESGKKIASYWHSNLTINMIGDMGEQVYPKMAPPGRQYVTLESTGARDETGQNGWYYPVVFPNDFWLLRGHMVELNTTVKTLPLHVTLSNIRPWQFQIYSTMDESFKLQAQQNGGQTSELDEVKRVLVETNMYLLGTTFFVSLLHMLFEMLAFKSDISHWRNKKDNVGISVRTILANVFMQLVVFLYLIDNSDGTSWMILFGQGMGIVLEAWKITKTVDVKVRDAPGTLLGYKVTFEDKHKLSETEEKTKEYDAIAFNYMYIAAVPLLLAYAVYSLMYDSHKGWYSFVITTLVGSVYAYGFLMMVPSLYINYRLKSVAHLPRKTMMYKFLNTFIDDLFAFTIKMPTLHRLATLRDDVIFFVYLYQAWKYKVDYTRVNEFGQGGDDEPVAAIEGAETVKLKVGEITADGTTVETMGDAVKVDEKVGGKKASGNSAKEGGRKRK